MKGLTQLKCDAFNSQTKNIKVTPDGEMLVLIDEKKFRFEIMEDASFKDKYFIANRTGGSNSLLFNIVEVDKYSFIRSVVGYLPDKGECPYVRSIEDLLKVLLALDKKLKTNSKPATSSSTEVVDFRKSKNRYTFKFTL